ncbi:GTP-binding protein 10 homolog [Bacillus rossius redtenbacheri]|uniref:GTP-binding protein 10 homolog n=1 Tax=Bacillus rossius redtenbacheri TaxID=93214 RepID=UPI002FDDBE04
MGRHHAAKFIDSLRLHVRGGAGGTGYPKYGGVGGPGGSVYVVAKEGCSLRDVVRRHPTKRVAASGGGNSQARRILGEPGTDVTVQVPVGVSVIDDCGRNLGELDADGSSVLVARGGPGGCPTNQYNGARGQAHTVTLDLKLIADVGLVGFPNAGKSTLLKAISRASPRIASYPFTTLRPSVGTVQYPDLRQLSVADLPGLVEGAHANEGLGHRFLKHVERTKLLLLVVDALGFRLSPRHRHRSCLETVLLLNKELELYKEDLLLKPAVLVVNKMDLSGADAVLRDVKAALRDLPGLLAEVPEELRPTRALQLDDVLAISARSDARSVQRVKWRLRELLDLHAEQRADPAATENQAAARLSAQTAEAGPRLV